MHRCAFEHNIDNTVENIELRVEKDFFALKDEGYKEFTASLIPTVDKNKIIGVRTPQIREYMRFLGDANNPESAARLFLRNKHRYYELDNLHAAIISSVKDFNDCIDLLDGFLPLIDNWATCDMLRPKCFNNNKQELLLHIKRWIDSGRTYVIRFGIEMLMCHFLDGDFENGHLSLVMSAPEGEYYVDMMVAWYFATALAKQWDQTVKILEQKRLSSWRHNKTISKACESFRISNEQKIYLKDIRVK